jgi:hypothetical protein
MSMESAGGRGDAEGAESHFANSTIAGDDAL